MTKNDFINMVGSVAKEDMKTSHVLASVTIAQAILESGWGSSGLAKKGNNLFGIKGSYYGESVLMATKECYEGKWVTIKAEFRKYPSVGDSIHDHSQMFNRMDRYKNLLNDTDYERVCRNLQKDGYATDPDYPSKLIKIIEDNNLVRFDSKIYEGSSIVEYLDFLGLKSSIDCRRDLAKKYGIKGYIGTATQNEKLLKLLRGF